MKGGLEMERARRLLIIFLVGIILWLFLMIGASCTAEKISARLPNFSAGDCWLYKEGKESIIFRLEFLRQERDWLLFLQDDGDFIIYKNLQLGIVKVVDAKTGNPIFFYEHPMQVVQFPLAAGKKWSFCYCIETNAGSVLITFNHEVIGYKKIKMQVGEFDIFEILCRKMVSGYKNGKVLNIKTEFIYWFAPKAKNIIRIIDLEPSELMEYKVR